MLGHMTDCMTVCVDGDMYGHVCVDVNVRDIQENVHCMIKMKKKTLNGSCCKFDPRNII